MIAKDAVVISSLYPWWWQYVDWDGEWMDGGDSYNGGGSTWIGMVNGWMMEIVRCIHGGGSAWIFLSMWQGWLVLVVRKIMVASWQCKSIGGGGEERGDGSGCSKKFDQF